MQSDVLTGNDISSNIMTKTETNRDWTGDWLTTDLIFLYNVEGRLGIDAGESYEDAG